MEQEDETTTENPDRGTVEHENEALEAAADEANVDPYADLRTLREGIAEDRVEFFDIPGYKGRLAAKYRRLEYKEAEKIGNRVQKLRDKRNPNATLFGHCDTLIEALIGIYLRKDPDKPDELEPLTKGYAIGDGDEANWLNAARVTMKDGQVLPSDDHRAAVRAVFNNDLAIAPHVTELSRWMASVRLDEEEDFTLDSLLMTA